MINTNTEVCPHLGDEVGGDNHDRFEEWEDENLGLKMKLLRGIYANGFETPSPIQKKALIPIIKERDIIAQAQSGTGKTGAFVIGSLQLINEDLKQTQVIIISPTRELSRQNYEVAKTISQFQNITPQLLIGGTSTDDDKELLNNNVPQIVIGYDSSQTS